MNQNDSLISRNALHGILCKDSSGAFVLVHQVEASNTLYQKQCEQLEAMREAIKLASVALDMADGEVYPPQANCSCHISPPCNDCVDHSQARETKEFIKRALAKLQPFLKP